jgi:exonuclease III
MASVKILSVNCQGLGNIVKRTDVFNYLKKKQCNIYCLQDTHFNKYTKIKLKVVQKERRQQKKCNEQ